MPKHEETQPNTQIKIFQGEPLSISYADRLKELDEIAKNAKPTDAFYLPELQLGRLSIVVGTSNSGKTYWSLGTALSLAREGYTIQYISTEEPITELVKYMDENKITGTEDELNRFIPHYKPVIEQQNIKLGLDQMIEQYPETNVIMIDYLRTDWTAEESGNWKLIMEAMLTEIRTFFDLHPQVAIIATIQANAELYRSQDAIEELIANPSKLGVMIDGGLAPYRRAHGVAVLINNIKLQKRQLLVLKGKGRNYNAVGQIQTYVVKEGFAISYEKDAFGPHIKTAEEQLNQLDLEKTETGLLRKKRIPNGN